VFEKLRNLVSCNLSVSAATSAFNQQANLVSCKVSVSAAVMPGSQPPAHTSEAEVRNDQVSCFKAKNKDCCNGVSLRQVQKNAPCPLAAVHMAAAD